MAYSNIFDFDNNFSSCVYRKLSFITKMENPITITTNGNRKSKDLYSV